MSVSNTKLWQLDKQLFLILLFADFAIMEMSFLKCHFWPQRRAAFNIFSLKVQLYGTKMKQPVTSQTFHELFRVLSMHSEVIKTRILLD